MKTRVRRWGNSLAVLLPAELVKELGLVEGDDVDITAGGTNMLELSRATDRELAIQTMRRIRELSRPLPPDYKLDRGEIHERGGDGDSDGG